MSKLQNIGIYNKHNEEYFLGLRRSGSLKLFNLMSSKIPAYKKFIKSQKINSSRVVNAEDLQKVPPISKLNYFKKYKVADLLWPGQLESSFLVGTSTSGSTGTPAYFLRNESLDKQYADIAEFFLNNGEKGPTLLVNCFGMGVWIGGLITYQAFYEAGQRGNQISIMTPGINKKEIFNCLRELAPAFKTIIFSGYPPFIKDLIDELPEQKIDIKKYHCRFLFAAESFTEAFRDYLAGKVKMKNVYKDTLNIYGSAELGAMAFETPTTVLIRKLALRNLQLQEKIFTRSKVPTLCQYNPHHICFEESNGELLITANSAMPVCRYSIGDNGGVFTFTEIKAIFQEYGINLEKEANKKGVKLTYLPFVYVYERTDFSVTLYGLQIYPQSIKRALEDAGVLNQVTGKFNLETAYDSKNNQFLKINIELQRKKKPAGSLRNKILKFITKRLLRENSEYRELSTMLESGKTKPRLEFWPYNDELYFRSGIKQQWRKK